jgi:hypothetical protein
MKKITFGFCLFLFFGACKESPSTQSNAAQYFDLTGYFDNEALRLSKINPTIKKQVTIDTSSEQKAILITDWAKEFNVFKEADINKASWIGLFKIEKSDAITTYTSNDDKIAVKKLEISYQHGKINRITAILNTSNMLYHSSANLNYYPDSLYSIYKTQKIKLMDAKAYKITGSFK